MLKSLQRPRVLVAVAHRAQGGQGGVDGCDPASRALDQRSEGASGDLGGAFQKAGLAAGQTPRAKRPGTGEKEGCGQLTR